VRLDEDACWARMGVSGHGVLGTVHPERGVDAVPVVFARDGARLIIPIDAVKAKSGVRLQRLVNLDTDDRAVLLVDRYDADWSHLWWVRSHGHAVETTPSAEVLAALGEAFPAYRASGSVTSVIVLSVETLTGWAAEPEPGLG
jgi:PPOX class probable F420-dependent enzyme